MGTLVVLAQCGYSSPRYIAARLLRLQPEFRILQMLTSRGENPNGSDFDHEFLYDSQDQISRLQKKKELLISFSMGDDRYAITSDSVKAIMKSDLYGIVILPEEHALKLAARVKLLPGYASHNLFVRFGLRNRSRCEDADPEVGEERMNIEAIQKDAHPLLTKTLQLVAPD